MLIPPKMKTNKDCGLTAKAFVISDILNLPYDTVYYELKKIMEYNDCDLDDNPAEHERVINEYGKQFPDANIKFSLVKDVKSNLFSGKLPNNRTIFLVHDCSGNNPITKMLFGALNQHWCVLHSIYAEKEQVVVWWGNGTIQSFSFDKFEDMLTNASPQCVYTIGESSKPISNPWYSKLYSFIVNIILKIFRK